MLISSGFSHTKSVAALLVSLFSGTLLHALTVNSPADLPCAGAAIENADSRPRSTVTLRALDPDGAAVPGARVTALAPGCRDGLSAVADATGEVSLQLLPGSYEIRVMAPEFREIFIPARVTEDALRLGDVTLQIAAHAETLTVNERAPQFGGQPQTIASATKTLTPLIDIPQAITVIPNEVIREQSMQSIADVVRYVPGVSSHQGENNRDQVVIRGNSTSADFFVNGVRDDVQYYRDLYNLERVEALKGPNAMIFGRGGAGGVINRVTKQAEFASLRELSLQGGRYGKRRFAADFNQPLRENVAVRLNSLYEAGDSFRDHVDAERYGVSPTATFTLGGGTQVKIGYEHFRDHRTADRGIPSWNGRPADIPTSRYFGDPDQSPVRARVNIGSVVLEHWVGPLSIRNNTLVGDYDRGYQNFVPGAVTADHTRVTITAYNNATARRNIFNQTDLTYTARTGPLRHTLLGGVEVGRQTSNNFRNTGFFNNSATSILAGFDDPTVHVPVTFRQSATDADNRVRTNVAAVYAQDQIALTSRVQLIAGVRFDRFDLRFHNNRTSDDLQRVDHLVSPRAGIVFKPVSSISLYGSYGVSYLPSSGDQFSSLTSVTQQVKPERFNNYEAGIKWDAARSLSLTAAVYRLDRTNTRATDPNDPTRILQTGSQRTNGVEIGASGRITRAWTLMGGYAYQDAFVTSATVSARAGAQVAQVPHHSMSLWNRYQIMRRVGLGMGLVHRTDVFAAIDNTVTLPGYTVADGAVFVSLNERVGMQVNMENLLNRRYYVNADGNNNISPGAPRGVRVGMTARF